jgi:hypothetical protein
VRIAVTSLRLWLNSVPNVDLNKIKSTLKIEISLKLINHSENIEQLFIRLNLIKNKIKFIIKKVIIIKNLTIF